MPIESSIVDSIFVSNILYNLYKDYPLRKYNYFNGVGFKGIYNINKNSIDGLTFINEKIKDTSEYLEPYFKQYSKIDKIHFAVGVDYFNQKQLNMAYREFYLAYAQNMMCLPALNNMAALTYVSGDRKTAYTMLKYVCQLNPKYKVGLLNLWLWNKLNDNEAEAKKLEVELDNLEGEYHNIQNFTIDLGK